MNPMRRTKWLRGAASWLFAGGWASWLALSCNHHPTVSPGSDESDSGRSTDHGGGAGDTSGGGAFGSEIDPGIALEGGQGGQTKDDSLSGEDCAESRSEQRLAPAHIVFLLDHSGSMGDDAHGGPERAWDPVTSAMLAFFSSEDSAGISAALSVFPTDKNQTDESASSAYSTECEVDAYQEPLVPLTALPNEDVFAEALEEISPPNEWGTPTRPALLGVMAYAGLLAEDEPTARVAVIIVTDGQPAQCGAENSVAGTAEVAASMAESIPTYVIGVGTDLVALDEIAAGGGTEKATLVSVSDPTETSREIATRIDEIRGQELPCNLQLPAPPPDEELDFNRVNVEATIDDEVVKFAKDKECDVGGWHYDDDDAPSEIVLCPETCGLVRAKPESSVTAVFGCATTEVQLR